MHAGRTIRSMPSAQTPRLLVAAALAALLAVALAGCGSANTKRDFVARADAICAAATREERALPPPGATVTLAGYLTRVAGVVAREARDLRRLPRPQQRASQRRELASYLDALGAAATEFRAAAQAAASGDSARLLVSQSALASSRAPALATAYGLATCGNPGATYRSGG